MSVASYLHTVFYTICCCYVPFFCIFIRYINKYLFFYWMFCDGFLDAYRLLYIRAKLHVINLPSLNKMSAWDTLLHHCHIAWYSIKHFHVFGNSDKRNFAIVYKVSLVSLLCYKFVGPAFCYYRLTEIWYNVCSKFCESFWKSSVVERAHSHIGSTVIRLTFPLKWESRQQNSDEIKCFRSVLILLASCQQTCMTYTIAVCTVKNSRWCTEELSETCRVLFQK